MRITAEEVTRHPFTLKVVRKYARRLIQRGCFSEDERGAVEQELMSKVLENWPKFDESVGHHKSFVCTIVSNSSLNLSRRIDAKCRGSRPVSLSSIIHDPFDGATELAQTIGESELDRRLERKPRLSPTDRVALLHDLQQVMASLTSPTASQRNVSNLLTSSPHPSRLLRTRKDSTMTKAVCYKIYGQDFHIEPESVQFANAVFHDEYRH